MSSIPFQTLCAGIVVVLIVGIVIGALYNRSKIRRNPNPDGIVFKKDTNLKRSGRRDL